MKLFLFQFFLSNIWLISEFFVTLQSISIHMYMRKINKEVDPQYMNCPNTHLYFANTERSVNSQNSLSELPGRRWKILGAYTRVKDVQRVCARASVLTRNYVLPADALHKQLRLKDGGDEYIIGCRIADKPLLLHCRRV